MFLVVSISGSSEFCSDAKGSIYTLHVEYCKHHRSFHMCGINKQVRFLKKLIKSYALKYDFPERTWRNKIQSHTVSSLQRVSKHFLNKS